MAFDRSPKTVFDEVAQIYAEVRPGYPAQLFEDVVTLSGITLGRDSAVPGTGEKPCQP